MPLLLTKQQSICKGVIVMSFDKQKYDAEYAKQAYDFIRLYVPKGKRAELKRLAEQHNLSVNRFIIEAVETQYHIDLSK